MGKIEENYDIDNDYFHANAVTYFDYNGCLPSDDDVADMIKPLKSVIIYRY